MKHICSLGLLLCYILLSCSPDSDDIIETNAIGGYYFFINETTHDSIDNTMDRETVLKAHNGDSLRLLYKSASKSDWGTYMCRTTFFLHDGSKHTIEDTNDKDMQYGFVLQNATQGRKTFLAFSEIIDKKVRYTGKENIVVFKLLVE